MSDVDGLSSFGLATAAAATIFIRGAFRFLVTTFILGWSHGVDDDGNRSSPRFVQEDLRCETQVWM